MSRTAARVAFRPLGFEGLPLFASEKQLADAILGPGNAAAWNGIVKILEERGLPAIDAFHGGRYVPAVKQFYDIQYGVRQEYAVGPAKEPHRPAEFGAPWKLRSSPRRA